MAMEALRIAAKESKIMKFVLGGFVFLAVGGLVFTDVGGYFRDGVGRNEVAVVGDTVITLREFDNDLRGVLQQTGLAQDEAYETGLINAYLQSRVNNILQLQAAQELDLYLDNKAIAAQVRTMFGNMPRDQIEMALRAQGLSEQAVANSIRTQILNQYVTALPLAVANYTPDFVLKAESKLQSQTRSGTIYTIELDELTEDIDINDADIEQYYTNNQADFTIPEQRVFVIGTMSMDMAKQSLPDITEKDAMAVYNERKRDYETPETRDIAQVTVKNPDDAQAIYEAALNGTPLQKTLEEVTGSNNGYRDVAAYEAEGLPSEISEKAFDENVKAGDVTPPVKTLLGYTVTKVTGITPPRQKSFDEVKDDLKKELQQAQVYDALYNKMIDTEDMIDSGESFNVIAEKTGLKTETTPAYGKNEAALDTGKLGELLTASPSDLEELYALPAGGVTYPYEIDDENYVVIGVESIVPETLRPLEEVSNEIETILVQQERQDYVDEILSENLDNFEESLLKDIAKTKAFSNIGRDSDDDYVSTIFSLSESERTYEIEDDQAIVIEVNEISANSSESAEGVSREAIIQKQRTLFDVLLSNYYKQKVDIAINNDLLEATYSASSTQ